MKNLTILLFAIFAFTSTAFAEDKKVCHDLHETHKHVEQAIKTLEHHRDAGKRGAIIDALKSALNDIKVERENLGCK